MFKHYLKTAFRNITRNIGYSIINFIGLSIGIALFILINLYVINEYSYDRFNKNYGSIYRLEEGENFEPYLPSAMGLDAQEWFPEIEKVVRFKFWGDINFQYETTTLKIPNIMLTDSSFFDVFTTQFIKGDPNTAFEVPNSIILTERIADIFFGDSDPVNQIIKTARGTELVVKGVIKEHPNFHLRIGALIPFNILGQLNGKEYLRSYGTWQFQTYLLLPEAVNVLELNKKLEAKFTEHFYDELEGDTQFINLRPLKDVYFANYCADLGAVHGNKNYVKLFFAIGIFIIAIACINFINLTTAKASSRATEVGIKKVHGGIKQQLIFQFLTESIFITFISYLVAITIVQASLPIYNNLVQKELMFDNLFNSWFIVLSIAGVLITGIFAGIYPSFYLTAFSPVQMLKGEKTKGKSAEVFRKVLIVIQFTISIALIISTLTVQKQLDFLKNKDMGFRKDHIISVRLNSNIWGQKESFKQQLKEHPEIIDISFSSGIIGTIANGEAFDFNGNGVNTGIQLHSVDPEFITLFELELIEGRNFSFNKPSDAKQTIILNEEAVKAAGLKLGETAGTIFYRDNWYLTALPSKKCEIIGVVKNFHYKSLHEEIGPQGLAWNTDWARTINIKCNEGAISQTIDIVEKVFKQYSENIPFEYQFIDDYINSLYASEHRLGKFFKYFSLIAIIIAMLGLFGLATFIAEIRTKEIGIRRVLGSSAAQIFYMISKEFIKWVLVANLIAIPLAYYGMSKWLQTFAFKIKITLDIFIYSTLISLMIALTTIFYQSLKASNKNPADSLRYE